MTLTLVILQVKVCKTTNFFINVNPLMAIMVYPILLIILIHEEVPSGPITVSKTKCIIASIKTVKFNVPIGLKLVVNLE